MYKTICGKNSIYRLQGAVAGYCFLLEDLLWLEQIMLWAVGSLAKHSLLCTKDWLGVCECSAKAYAPTTELFSE